MVYMGYLLVKDKLPNVLSFVGAVLIIVALKGEIWLKFGLVHSLK
jgi:hypothetical protein|tara:strand:- start:421 stop:555 length:135 start_codon:yes stop_codon:yes gene_type:complete